MRTTQQQTQPMPHRQNNFQKMFIYRAHNHHNFNNFLCHTSDKQLQGSRQEQLIIEELIIKHEGVISQTHSVQAVGQFEMMTTDQYNRATVSQRSTNNRELKHKTFVSHRWQPEVKCFLSWCGFAPHNRREKLLLDDCGLMLQTRWCQNAPKRKNSTVGWLSVAHECLCLLAP